MIAYNFIYVGGADYERTEQHREGTPEPARTAFQE